MVTKVNNFNSTKGFKLCTDQKYLSIKTLVAQLANSPAFTRTKPIVNDISEETLRTVFINVFIINSLLIKLTKFRHEKVRFFAFLVCYLCRLVYYL